MVAASLNAKCIAPREKRLNESGTRQTGKFRVRRYYEEEDFVEIHVAVVGNVNAGKSTLLNVLSHGELDDGHRVARENLFRHKHEAESGRTSSVGNDILGLDNLGAAINKTDHGNLN